MQNKSKIFKWALILGIIIVLNLFFNYAISLFYKQPDYSIYFPQSQVVEPIETKDKCLKIGGQWNEGSLTIKPNDNIVGKGNVVGNGQNVPIYQNTGYCDPNFTRQQEFNKAQKEYDRNVFIILVLLGVISFLVGVFISNEIIVVSFSWGGVLSFIVASMRYWSNAGNLVKVLILAVALSALIWLAIKKYGKENKNEELRS